MGDSDIRKPHGSDYFHGAKIKPPAINQIVLSASVRDFLKSLYTKKPTIINVMNIMPNVLCPEAQTVGENPIMILEARPKHRITKETKNPDLFLKTQYKV